MKTRELVKSLEFFSDGRDYYVAEDEYEVYLYAGHEELLLSVEKRHQYHVETSRQAFHDLSEITKQILFGLVTEYAKTPLEERVEEKRYRYQLSDDFTHRYFNWNKRVEGFKFSQGIAQNAVFKSYFTDIEFESLPIEVRNVLSVCEKVEVTE